MVAKRSPRKSASLELVALDHRAHRAVEDEDAVREELFEGAREVHLGLATFDPCRLSLSANAVTTCEVGRRAARAT